MTLKEKLLTLNVFEDNEYLDKYVELIENNRETKREKFKTQRHHIIPKYYFKENNLEIDNSKENLVNLVYKDHAKSHYYLALCSSDVKLKVAMTFALNYIMFGKCSKEPLIEILDDDALDNLQILYSIVKKHATQIMSFNNSKIAMIKDGKQYYVDLKDVDEKINLGYQRGFLVSTIEKIKNTNKHKIWITNGFEDVYIDDDEIIPNDFYRGRSINYFQVKKTPDSERKRRYNISIASKGKQYSKQTRERIAYTLKYGEQRTSLRKWMNNGIINARVLQKDINNYEKNGWTLGKIGKNKPATNERKQKIGNANRNRRHVHKDNVLKFVRQEDLNNYLKDGWMLGYIRKKDR